MTRGCRYWSLVSEVACKNGLRKLVKLCKTHREKAFSSHWVPLKFKWWSEKLLLTSHVSVKPLDCRLKKESKAQFRSCSTSCWWNEEGLKGHHEKSNQWATLKSSFKRRPCPRLRARLHLPAYGLPGTFLSRRRNNVDRHSLCNVVMP